jgi:polysaccharide biosynthesis/export protein
MVDTRTWLPHSVSGSSLLRVVKVRGVPGLLNAKVLSVAGLVGACLWPRPAYSQKVETAQQTNEKILQLASRARTEPMDIPIGAGDLVHVDVFDVPELSRDVRVSQTGDVSYPLLPGLIHFAGLNTFELEKKMAQLFLENGLVSHPQVSVSVKERNSQPVSIVGAVQHPMVYQVVRPTTLLQILAEAGGISGDAGGDVIITRPVPAAAPASSSASSQDADPPAPSASASPLTTADPPPDSATDPPPPGPEVIRVHLQDLLDSPNSGFDIPVHGGDVIRVPKAGIVYILGPGIAAPGGYVLQGQGENVTVLRAVALAHGLTSFAKADSAVLLRTNPETGKRDEIRVEIKKIEKNKIPDVLVKSNDILYIPDSTSKKAFARAGQAAIGIGTSVTIYRVAY